MPTLQAWNAGTVMFDKRSRASHDASIDNPPFYRDNTTTLQDDAKKMTGGITKAVDSGGRWRSAVAGLRGAVVPRIVASCIAAAAGTLTATPALSCSALLQPMQRIELIFGRALRGHAGGVGDASWARFLAREITPRFPDGLTVIDAAGQWRDPASGRVTREPSRLVIIVTAAGAPVDDRIAAIVAAYKARFRQKSVGVVVYTVCAAF